MLSRPPTGLKPSAWPPRRDRRPRKAASPPNRKPNRLRRSDLMEKGSSVEKLIREFITESSEAMDKFDVLLMAMEKDGASPEELDDIFRIAHTLKGGCGYL